MTTWLAAECGTCGGFGFIAAHGCDGGEAVCRQICPVPENCPACGGVGESGLVAW